MGVPQIFTELVKSESKISFGEGDKKTEKPIADVFSDFLSGLPELVPGGDISKGAVAARKTGKLVQFNEPKNGNMEIDQESAQFAEAAQAMVNEDKTGKLTTAKRSHACVGSRSPAALPPTLFKFRSRGSRASTFNFLIRRGCGLRRKEKTIWQKPHSESSARTSFAATKLRARSAPGSQ
jgi:hypothetical protein